MNILRSERIAAVLLIAAAALGLALANSPVGSGISTVVAAPLPLPFLGFSLSVGGWVKDGLLAMFFLIAAIELRHELTQGELASPRRALVPVAAAVGGVIVPAIVFLLIVGASQNAELTAGWPIPTATDVAFALGVLAVVGRGLPARIRALLLALAVIDDLIAIIIIGVFFTTGLQPLPLLLAVPIVLVFGWLSYRRSKSLLPVLIVLGLAAWLLVALSGIHPTIAGVAIGLILAPAAAARVRHALEPIVNAAILPIFAFVAALVVIPAVGLAELNPVFWAILVALPLGKLVGITAGGMIASALAVRRSDRVPFGDLLVVAGLGGIGFTVSLLMNDLAFGHLPVIPVEGTLAVLAASTIAAVIGATLAATRGAHYRRLQLSPEPLQ